MKARVALVAITLALALVVSSVAPRRAYALDDLAMYGLISGGVVMGILIIAIVGTALTRDDPRFLSETTPGLAGAPFPAQTGIRVGSGCSQGGTVGLVVCW